MSWLIPALLVPAMLGLRAAASACDFTCAISKPDFQPLFPSTTPSNGSQVQVITTFPRSNAASCLIQRSELTAALFPEILAFDADGQLIGNSSWPQPGLRVYDGAVNVVPTNDTASSSQQPTFLQLFSEQPFCLASVSLKTGNYTPSLWGGDLGYECGSRWYYSNGYGKGDGAFSYCAWVDAGIQMKMIEIGPKTNTTFSPSTFCTPQSLFLTPQLPYNLSLPAPPTASLFNSQPIQESQPASAPSPIITFTYLIASTNPNHSATYLCNSSTSLGPDFISLSEKVFCNMTSKESYPLCRNGTGNTNCFDIKKEFSHVDEKFLSPYSSVELWQVGKEPIVTRLLPEGGVEPDMDTEGTEGQVEKKPSKACWWLLGILSWLCTL